MSRHRGITIAAAYLAFCAVYLGAPRLAISSPMLLQRSAIDRAIPFLPWTIAIYLSQFAFLFLALWHAADARRLLTALAIATLVSAVVFVVYPTAIVRPQTSASAFHLLWLFDVPANCLPSLHVALAAAGAAFWPLRRSRPAAALWAIAIAVSTLTTKQHYFVDVAAGLAVGVVSISLAAAIGPAFGGATARDAQRP